MKQHEASLRKTEEIKQLQREKEGLELDIDIIKQLKVKLKSELINNKFPLNKSSCITFQG